MEKPHSNEAHVLLGFGHMVETQLLDLATVLITSPEVASKLSSKTETLRDNLESLATDISSLVKEACELYAMSGSRTKNSLISIQLKEILPNIETLYTRKPSLQKHMRIVETLVGGGLASEEDRNRICLELRLAFEELLNTLCQHFNCPLEEGMPIGDRVLFLKKHLNPPVRLNAFFDLKEYSSLGLHKSVTGSTDGVTLRQIEKMLTAFRCVVEEVLESLKSAPSPDKKVVRSTNAARYKSTLCRNYMKYKTCPHEAKCMFAHGEEELKS